MLLSVTSVVELAVEDGLAVEDETTGLDEGALVVAEDASGTKVKWVTLVPALLGELWALVTTTSVASERDFLKSIFSTARRKRWTLWTM